jgi:hypothetical protein
LMY